MAIQRSVAGYLHTHTLGDFYFTPIREEDQLMSNFHLSGTDIEKAERVETLDQIKDLDAAANIALADGDTFEGNGYAGILWTPLAATNPLLLRSPAARLRLILKRWYKATVAKPQTGQQFYKISLIGDLQVRVSNMEKKPVPFVPVKAQRVAVRVKAQEQTGQENTEDEEKIVPLRDEQEKIVVNGATNTEGLVEFKDVLPGVYLISVTIDGRESTAQFEIHGAKLNVMRAQFRPRTDVQSI